MTLQELVLDTVAKTPSPQVYGEICDMLVASVKKQSGSEHAAMYAAEYYLTEIQKKFPNDIKL